MQISKFVKIFITSMIILLTILTFTLFYQYNKALKNAFENIQQIERLNARAFAKNIETYLKSHYQNAIDKPFELEEKTQDEVNSILSMFAGENYAFVFVIAFDKDRYRYIFDGANNPEDKGEYLQKFDPTNIDKWEQVYATKKPVWVSQEKQNGLWLTYLYPILKDGETKLILAFDFSTKEYLLIKRIFSPLNTYIIFIAGTLLLFLALLYIVSYALNKQHKKTFIDALTGLYNRHYLREIQNAIKLRNICIAIIDIDHFKRVNDTYGHDVGDFVLKEFTRVLQQTIRKEDILIRYGGEEFLLLLDKKNIAPGKEVQLITSMQKRISSKTLELKNEELLITASIGFNATPNLNRNLEDAITTADTMLYAAKINGRNRVEIFKEARSSDEVIFGPREVQQALKENRMHAFFQPIIDSKTQKIVKYEMLIRLFSRSGAVILPYKFLPNIRGNSAHRDITKFMLNRAIETIKERHVNVSINFDVGDFLDITLYEQIYDTIKDNQSFAKHLTIELLENIEINDFPLVCKHINALRDFGIKVAIDDFGAGYSNFNYLLALQTDVLKIDGSIITQLTKNLNAQKVVSHLVAICEELGIQTVAEFVETKEDIKLCHDLGITHLQGYAIGKPEPYLLEDFI